jgi:DNA helicase II / ATP-dependent DNA helicase PcrA
MPKTAKKKALKPRSKKKAAPIAAAEVSVATAGHGYVIGSRVSHRMFGDGTVTAIDGDKLLIKFKDGRVKQIVDYYVKHRGR